ncbi:hypothetical protein ABEB36_014253 [Hypothenemus hampei]|uniref:HTH psq-type domain-containing protein n=1 Tax=Hypothenemus hampei TaxID=57062 RepID=A0ABD1E3T8_HYPHA
MGRYKRTSDRKLIYSQEILNEIKEKIKSGRSKRSLATEYGTKESTLRKRFKPVFTVEMETELSEQIRRLDKLFFGLTFKHFVIFV